MSKHIYIHCRYGEHSKMRGRYLGWPTSPDFPGLRRCPGHGTCHGKVPAKGVQIGHPMGIIPIYSWGTWGTEKRQVPPDSPSKAEVDAGLSLLPSSKSTFASRQLLPFPLCLPFPWNCKKTNVIFCLLCALLFQNCALGILWMLVNVALCGYPTSLRRNNIATLCFKENDTGAEKL